jgi:hypothetical protein
LPGAPARLALQRSRTRETPPPGRQKRADIAKNGFATQRRILWVCRLPELYRQLFCKTARISLAQRQQLYRNKGWVRVD